MNNQNDSDFFIVVFIAAALGLMALTFKFSNAFNLDWETGSKVFLGLVIVTGLMIASIYTQWFSIVYPFILGFFWFVCWPALDYWAVGQYSFGLYGEIPWWAQWYTKGAVLLALVGTPYLIKKIRSPY